ncbi:hypothetical protein GCM10023194_45040 [Planotetraspora phitsanulokensis]|uniref:Uncharacterized protein n=1 Tax=Planotetraspora phitsanulokensis TaxID=575192 RepID=A0A8J3XEH2_9ACTN|nr:hypothetical protein [Planotetraspora phitsanulokensis]GII38105.1 hypothetical protein Pph01_31080 [Planotetraspora phitsanulokensis]
MEIAVTGSWSGYRSPSEARPAVGNSLAAGGRQLVQVITEIEHGAWGDLAMLLERRRAVGDEPAPPA